MNEARYFFNDGTEVDSSLFVRRLGRAGHFATPLGVDLSAPLSQQGARPIRKINYKINGTGHKCDSRCMNAPGMNCECSCGGKNHGANLDR